MRDGSPTLWRVLVGSVQTQDAADDLARKIRQEASNAFVVRLDSRPAIAQAPQNTSAVQ